MKILNLQVRRFGKLKDFEWSPDVGLNILRQPNEFGKTTLIYFIFYMFYGYDAKRIKPYLPWSGEEAAGRILFEQEGKRWQIERRHPAKGAEKRQVLCLDTGEELKLPTREQPGPHFLGLDSETFLRSFCITQGDLLFSRTDGLDVALKNMAATGDENVSYRQAEDYLNKQHTRYMYRGKNQGPLLEMKERLAAGRMEQQELRRQVDARITERQEWEVLQQETAQKEEQIHALRVMLKQAEGSDALKLLRRLDALKNLPRAEKPKVSKEEITALEQAFEQAERARFDQGRAEEHLEKFQAEFYEKKLSLWPILLLIAGGAAAVAAAAIPFWPLYLAAVALVLVALILSLPQIAARKRLEKVVLAAKNEREQAQKRAEAANRALEALREKYRIFSKEEVQDLRIAWGVYESAAGAETLALQEQALLGGRTRAELELLAQDAKETEETAEQVRRRLAQAEEQLRVLRGKLETLRHQDLQALWARLGEQTQTNMNLEKQVEEGERQLAAIRLSLSWLREANEEMNTRFAPRLCALAGKHLAALTEGKYDTLTLDDRFAIRLQGEEGTHPAEEFSAGTRDAVYFAFRLAAGEMLSETPLPMVLDDPFTNLDPARKKAAEGLLQKAAEDRQILYFTCHE
ncbi:MAG: AAA family ATPase [Clostridia bacterium]|nr:AAA family ATPase [Clostridia bacterium]